MNTDKCENCMLNFKGLCDCYAGIPIEEAVVECTVDDIQHEIKTENYEKQE